MRKPLTNYLEQVTICYRENYSNPDNIRILLELYSQINSVKDEPVATYAFNNGMLIFQNPLIDEIVEEFKPSLSKTTMGQIMNKYPSCDIAEISKRLYA